MNCDQRYALERKFCVSRNKKSVLQGNQSMRDGKHRQLETRRDSGLVEGIREVPLDCFFAQPELFCDVAIAATLDNAADHLHFTWRKAEGFAFRDSRLFHQVVQCSDEVYDPATADPV